MKKIIILFYAPVFLLLLASCQKEYSFEGRPGAAAPLPLNYMLEGDPDSCFEYIVNGNYNQGVALTIDNTVHLMVNVSIVGPYSIQTETSDGISFSKSGVFTSTGSQEVILQGKGKPAKPGIFTFKPNSGFSSCTFNVAVTHNGPPATYQLPANPDGTCRSYMVPGSYYHGTPLNNNIMVVTVNVGSPGDFNISTNTINGITFSRTGKFSTTGLQTVQLIGRGTPKEIGVFVFTPYIKVNGAPIGEGCNVDVYVF